MFSAAKTISGTTFPRQRAGRHRGVGASRSRRWRRVLARLSQIFIPAIMAGTIGRLKVGLFEWLKVPLAVCMPAQCTPACGHVTVTAEASGRERA
jgi:hypothetical protein